MKLNFSLVDEGCFMFENPEGRWIIEHPIEGYMPTLSKMWDVLIEHPEHPHTMPLKFLGSFKTKRAAVSCAVDNINNGFDYTTIRPVANQYYNEEYKPK